MRRLVYDCVRIIAAGIACGAMMGTAAYVRAAQEANVFLIVCGFALLALTLFDIFSDHHPSRRFDPPDDDHLANGF